MLWHPAAHEEIKQLAEYVLELLKEGVPTFAQGATEDFIAAPLGEHVGKDFVEVLTDVQALWRTRQSNLVQTQVTQIVDVVGQLSKERTLDLGGQDVVHTPVRHLVQHDVRGMELAFRV